MDLTATCMCKENNLPIIVFDMDTVGNLKKVMQGEEIGRWYITEHSSAYIRRFTEWNTDLI